MVIFVAGACVMTENANIRQLRKKHILQYDVILVQKHPVIESESYGAENIRDTKRFYPILGRDVHSGYESTCFVSEEDYKKKEDSFYMEVRLSSIDSASFDDIHYPVSSS